MIHFMFMFNKQGKMRLQKWYEAYEAKMKKKVVNDLVMTILGRKRNMCAFFEYKEFRIVYKRYASLFIVFAVDMDDNELFTLDVLHRFVEILDDHFGSVCELDIIYNYEQVYYLLDEYILAGEVQESDMSKVVRAVVRQNEIQELETNERMFGAFNLG
ncbi:hypothetical protein L596_013768 [Steinernema carpocapsae]|uniref:AP complex subunit sigma n=1 Tax=Steinernema carpocapsae TaxID=34508 RepID=A0A4U5P296_STECR|nr:hypothetical protein L596_013768 [Steinernema carpocapsae]